MVKCNLSHKMQICKICNKEFDSEKGLHQHVFKTHNIHFSLYYHKFFPRYDKYTGELIKFKDKDYYFNNDFNNKISMRKWFNEAPQEEVKEYAKNLLLKTKIKKQELNCKKAPCQIELRSLMCPSIITFEKIFNMPFQKLMNFLGLECDYDYSASLVDNNKEIKVIIDTRENNPIKFKNFIVGKLDIGDYTAASEDFDNVFIDRKSLNDLCGTLSQGYERFCREIERSQDFDSYLVVLIEEDFNSLESIRYLPHTKHIKASPSFIFHRMRNLIRSYNNLQFLFLKRRSEMSNYICKILNLGKKIKHIDLQYFYDKKEF